jgi:hypothetical protein
MLDEAHRSIREAADIPIDAHWAVETVRIAGLIERSGMASRERAGEDLGELGR